MSLRLKFNLVMLFALAIGYVLIGYFSWVVLERNAREEVVAKARVMYESALAIRSYTVDEVRPLLRNVDTDEFMPQSVPSYAAQTNFRRVRDVIGDYTYKEAALNPTNPADRATDWEADIIRAFRNSDIDEELIVERDGGTGPMLALANPVRITNEGCLACHSTPDAAPAAMRALYGDSNGYGWNLGEVIGAQIVSVPMSVPLERAQQGFYTVMGSLAVAFLVVLLLMNLMLGLIVVRPIERLTELADEVSLGNLDAPEMETRGGGEIASLAVSFNRMRRSLENALRMID